MCAGMGRHLWEKWVQQLGRPCILVPLRKPAGNRATLALSPGWDTIKAVMSLCLPSLSAWPYGGPLCGGTGLSLHLHMALPFHLPGSTLYLGWPLPWPLVTFLRCSCQGISLTVAPQQPLPLLLPSSLLVSETKSHYVTQVQGALNSPPPALLQRAGITGLCPTLRFSHLIFILCVYTHAQM